MGYRGKSIVSFLVGCSGVVLLAPGVATAQTQSLTEVSGPSPYAGCTIGGPGTNYVNAEVEPWITVNPTNASNLAGAWQQDRWSNGGAHGLVAGYSFDGGRTWKQTTLPFSACASGGLPYERASDPWLSFGRDGKLYAVSISFNQSNPANSVAAATSSDGGRTWNNLHVIQSDTSSQYFNDKESVTADPVHPGVAYVVWDRLVSPNGNPDADIHAHAYTGPTMFSMTTDGGKDWSVPRPIVSTGEQDQTIGNQIVVDPRTDTLYDFFDNIVQTGSNSNSSHGYNVAFAKSTDGGKTWSSPKIIQSIDYVAVTDPNTGAALRTGDIIPEPAIDPSNGNLYVVWQDGRFSGGKYAEVAISSSTDGGQSWSAPMRVNTPTGKAAFNPAIQVNAHHVIGVTYYDLRNLTNQTSTLPTDVWFTTSRDNGQTFGKEVQLAGPFDMMTAPNSEGYFVGDYEGLASSGGTFYPFFVQANSGDTANPTNVYTTAVTP